jgi:hypothetical protein
MGAVGNGSAFLLKRGFISVRHEPVVYSPLFSIEEGFLFVHGKDFLGAEGDYRNNQE